MMRLHRKGFTLLELLAVLVILAVVSAIAVPIFSSKSTTSKQIAHNETVQSLLRQAYSYLLSKDTVTESEDIMQELIDNGYIKERPKYPLGDEEYLVRVDANGRVTVTPGMVEVTGVATGGSSGGEETPEETEPEDPEPIPPEGEQATVLNDVDGDGFKDIWYLEQLAYINTNTTTLSGSYELMRSLDFNSASSYLNTDNQATWTGGEGWMPIGNSTTPFTGIIDGNNYKISNLYVNRPTINHIGLLRYTDTTALIQNVGLINVNIQGDWSTGGLVGVHKGNANNCFTTGSVLGDTHAGGLVGFQYGEVNSCYSTVNVTGTVENTGGLVGYLASSGEINESYSTGDVTGVNYVGGLVGKQNGGTTSNCYSRVNVIGDSFVGGLVGSLESIGTVSNCYATGNVTGNNNYSGGLIGWQDSDGVINECYATGTLNGNNDVGGLVGNNRGTIRNSYSRVNVTGDSEVGGLVGRQYNGTIENSYATGNVTANSNAGGLVGYKNGTIRNCYASGNVTANSNAGGLVGRQYNGTIENSYATVTITGNNEYSGGLVGYQVDGTISSCYATGNVTGLDFTGGLVGYQKSGTINKCYATGIVSGSNCSGGLVGYQIGGSIYNSFATGNVSGGNKVGGLTGGQYGTISNCYATGYVSGVVWVGGLVGVKSGIMNNCFSTGNVEGDSSTGAIIGQNDSGAINNCYRLNTSTVNGITTNGGSSGKNGLNMTQEELKSLTFLMYYLGWNFDTIWSHNEGEYPSLGGEGLTKTFVNTNTITKIEDLMLIKDNLAGTYTLENDLDFNNVNDYRNPGNIDLFTNGTGWIPIGNSVTPFIGSFEGNNYKISNLYISRPSTDYVGLFGYTDTMSLIQNIELINVNIVGNWSTAGLIGVHKGTVSNSYITGNVNGVNHVGGLIGYLNGSIRNSFASVNVTGSLENTGGLVGYLESLGNIDTCKTTGDVTGNINVGGLLGKQNGGTINNCYAIGNVIGNDTKIGGLVGEQSNNGIISNCYATGSVTGINYMVGGLIGYKLGVISNCYASGNVMSSKTTSIGGIVGQQDRGSISNCYRLNTATVNGTTTNGTTSNINGANRTITELQSESFLRDTLLWDLDDIWQVVEDNWPVFK